MRSNKVLSTFSPPVYLRGEKIGNFSVTIISMDEQGILACMENDRSKKFLSPDNDRTCQH